MDDLNAIAARALADAKARVRFHAAHPAGTEEVTIGDGNGLVEAIAGSDWVYIRRHGGLFLARNLSGHKWKDGDRIPAEWLDTAPGHIMSIIYRERPRRTVLYAWAVGPEPGWFDHSVNGNAILMIDPNDDNSGATLTWESIGFPTGYGTDIGSFLTANGGVYLAGGADKAGMAWAYTRATGWVDLGLPLNNPTNITLIMNPLYLFAHDGAAHGLILHKRGAGLPTDWRLYRFDGTSATLRASLDTQYAQDPGSGISLNDAESAHRAAGSATPDGPGPVWACVENTELAPPIGARRFDSPQAGTLVVRDDGSLTTFANALPAAPIRQFFISRGKLHANKGYNKVIAAEIVAPTEWGSAGWFNRINEYDPPYRTTRDIDVIELTGPPPELKPLWRAYGAVALPNQRLVLYSIDAPWGSVIPNLTLIPLDGSAATTIGTPGFYPDQLEAVGGWVVVARQAVSAANLAAYSVATGWVTMSFPTGLSTNGMNLFESFVMNGAIHFIVTDSGGGWRIYRFDPPATSLTLVTTLAGPADTFPQKVSAKSRSGGTIVIHCSDIAGADQRALRYDGATLTALASPTGYRPLYGPKYDEAGVLNWLDAAIHDVYTSADDGNTWTYVHSSYDGSGSSSSESGLAYRDAPAGGGTIYYIKQFSAPFFTTDGAIVFGPTGARSLLIRADVAARTHLVSTGIRDEISGVQVIGGVPYFAIRDDSTDGRYVAPKAVYRYNTATANLTTIWTPTNGADRLWVGESL